MLHEAISHMPDVFETKLLLRGQEYFERGNVLNVRLSDGLLRGRVKGSSSQIYDVHMDLKTWPGKPARCTCPYQLNCKHAAACLFALRDREQKQEGPLAADRLDRKLDTWLKNLRAQEQHSAPKSEPTHHLVYIIELLSVSNVDKVGVRLALAKLLKRGGYGRHAVFTTLSESKKQYFQGDDEDIVAQLFFKCNVGGWIGDMQIRNTELLTRILATGRAYFSDEGHMPIRLGEALTGTCEWVLASNGSQSLQLRHEGKPIEPLLLDQCWYYDLEQVVMGQVQTPYTVKQLQHLLEAPPIPMEQAELLRDKMAKSHPELPSPKTFAVREIKETKPVPVLQLNAIYNMDEWDYAEVKEDIPVVFTAEVLFDYNGLIVSAQDETTKLVRTEGEQLQEYPRHSDMEDKYYSDVEQLLSLRQPDYIEKIYFDFVSDNALVLNDYTMPSDLDTLYAKAIPVLKQAGWRIEFLSPLFQQVINADELEWYSEAEESANDFFSYQLGIVVEGEVVSVVPLVADLIKRYGGNDLDNLPDDHQVKLPLPEGRVLQLEMGRIKPLVRLLLQFGSKQINENQQLQINKYQLILMQEAEMAIAALRARWRGAEQMRSQLRQLISMQNLPNVEQPKGLKASLRDYQTQGLTWLQFLRSTGFSGVLADDMGLGKTVQTLAHLQYEKEQGRLEAPSLIVAPTSLVGNWMAEAKKFTPELKVLVYHGSERHQDTFENYDLVVSTYGLIQRDKSKFTDTLFYYLILDEAQFIKNARTKTTQIIQQLRATHRLCLTGTPLENHLGELWSLFHFLMPGLLGDAKQFRNWFRTPIEKNADADRRELLVKRVKPFMLRRTKNAVASELPPKTEMTRVIEISGAQRDLYEAIRMSMEKKVRDAIAMQGLGKSHIVLLDALLKLRQICCDPRLLSLPEAKIAHGTSSKLDALMDLLDNLVEEGRRVLVFSQFTSMLQLIEEAITAKGYQYLSLTGQSKNRQDLVDRFQEGNIPIFLISLKAGGTGLNLTRADTVIHYDPWWNPAVEDQATDRTHRIGQENPVFVYKLITSGTVEEAILSMQERKRQLVEGILSSETAKTTALTEADIAQFFAPIS